MIHTAVLVLKFIINLRFKQLGDIPNFIRSCYDKDAIRVFCLFENTLRSLEKCKLDLDFLMKCKIYNIFPKILRFKLYKRCLQTTNFYKAWQAILLICEINSKRTDISKLTDQISDCRSKLKITFSHIIFCVIIRYVHKKTLIL